jgi:hypothetical protein
MIIEASIQDLTASTNSIDTTARQHTANQVQMRTGFQTIKMGADVVFQGETTTGHTPKLRITGFEVSEKPNAVEVVTASGPIKIEPLSKQAQAYVSCDCEDFVFRFATTDQARGVLFGKITHPYIPKTDRATQNLGKIGVCKHLIKFVDLLTSQGILK